MPGHQIESVHEMLYPISSRSNCLHCKLNAVNGGLLVSEGVVEIPEARLGNGDVTSTSVANVERPSAIDLRHQGKHARVNLVELTHHLQVNLQADVGLGLIGPANVDALIRVQRILMVVWSGGYTQPDTLIVAFFRWLFPDIIRARNGMRLAVVVMC